jgi:ubiquinone/menaquinone biosynthesis C-methylase UbiE
MGVWNRTLAPIQKSFRVSRAERIKRLFPRAVRGKVLDLGGSLQFWEAVGDVIKPGDLTILNVSHDGASLGDESKRSAGDRAEIVLYDGKTIPFPDQAFDLVICNSVIEHVPLDQRDNLTAEIARVGQAFVIQTPAFEFPIEPHFIMPILHWLPRRFGRRLASLSPYALIAARKYRSFVGVYFDEVNLLTATEMKKLRPTAKLHTERFALLPKSYLLVGGFDQEAKS